MITICIEGGPSWEELMNRMLSGRPVTFLTTQGPLQVLIEEMRETHATGDRVSFSGRVICKRTEAHACGDYNALFNTGRLCAAVFSKPTKGTSEQPIEHGIVASLIRGAWDGSAELCVAGLCGEEEAH